MIFSIVQSIISKELGIDANSITLSSDLTNDLDADSVEAVEIILALEDAFGIEFEDEDIANINTIQNLVDYIEANVESDF